MPSRTTKVSEKLVLIPETIEEKDAEENEVAGDDELAEQLAMLKSVAEDENRPLRDEELDVLRKRGGIRGKSYAERLPKVERADKVSRLTAYCTAQAYKMKSTAEFLRTKHEAKTKLYDDCLYTVYHLPLLAGVDGYRIRSRPILKTPGTGKTILDLEIERSEMRDYHEGYFDDDPSESSPGDSNRLHETVSEDRGRNSKRYRDSDGDHDFPGSPMNGPATDAKNFAEMFVFSYGVVVFWNFTENQEKDILADLTFVQNETGVSLVTRPLDQGDFETEQFHFEYSPDVKRPRVFNDMITLLPRSDHMVKLAISHAIAQSTKLCLFEERMSVTMLGAQHVPKTLALTGQLNMTRTEIVKILGQLFKSRVDINLCKLHIHCYGKRPRKLDIPPKNRLTNALFPSLKHPRRPQLLLGVGTHPAPPIRRRARVPRDRPPHPRPERALARLPRPGRDPLRQRRRLQDERHHLDHHRAHRYQHPRHRLRGATALRYARPRREAWQSPAGQQQLWRQTSGVAGSFGAGGGGWRWWCRCLRCG